MRDPNRTKLGRRQKKMLDDMRVFGNGHWLVKWQMNAFQKGTMQSLLERGLVRETDVNGQLTYSLTEPK